MTEPPSKKLLHVPRITQIDSKYLDSEVFLFLKEILTGAFAHSGQNFLVGLEPELEAALRAYLYHFTLGKANQTIGQQLLQVKYDGENSSSKVKYYYSSLILVPWLKQRITFLTNFIKTKRVRLAFKHVMDLLETVYATLDIANLLLFLVKGEYPTLVERIFNLKVISSKNIIRKISFAYFTRELLWNGFADLFATILPLIPAKQFHNFICQFLPSFSNEHSRSHENRESGKQETVCLICNELAILPHKFGCSHVACYYCIHYTLAAGSYRCPLCSVRIDHPSQVEPLTLK